MQPLQLTELPLRGVHLIEASAGTGKTFTIANLYLRLLLESEVEEGTPLAVQNILVVTFTNAATEELRGRIRARLVDAYQWMQRGDSDDPVLNSVMEPYREREDIVQRLTDAICLMDESSIFTIHGFCQRVLGDNAFESGNLFDLSLTHSDADLQREIIADYWREHFSQADIAQVEWLTQQWASPEALWQELRPLLQTVDLKLLPTIPEAGLANHLTESEAIAADLCTLWQQEGAEIRQLLNEDTGLSRAATTYRQDKLDDAYDVMQSLCEQPLPMTLPNAFFLLTQQKLTASLKKNKQAPEHRFFTLAGALWSGMAQINPMRKSDLIGNLLHYLREEGARRKALLRTVSFDDLLIRLDDALNGASGEALIAMLKQRYPVALIDEFQDTDPRQYGIFSRIYGDDPHCAWYMIGDPKQAIYSFRGADLFTYMQARNDAGSQFTLDTNWRSATPMVEAVNYLFSSASSPFIYDDSIPFQPVNAAGKSDKAPLQYQGKTVAPLALWTLPEPEKRRLSKEAATVLSASETAAEIARLLNGSEEGAWQLESRPLRASDIAVLVRSHSQAEAVRQALMQCGVHAVCTQQISIYATEESAVMSLFLRVLANPNDEARLRALLVSPLYGWTPEALNQRLAQSAQWQRIDAQLSQWCYLFQRYGFVAAFMQLLRDGEVAARLLSEPDGERRMTNLLQLAELLQLATPEHPGIEQLLHWYQQQRQQPDQQAEEQQLRLESDQTLVHIVTIHKSKGLEYPVVFLPFLWAATAPNDKRELVRFHHQGDNIVDYGSEQIDAHRLLTREEALAEDLRLLYVALTRAKYRCYCTFGEVNQVEWGAFFHVLNLDREAYRKLKPAAAMHEAMASALSQWVMQSPVMIESRMLSHEPQRVHYQPPESTSQKMLARAFGGCLDRRWSITSYSALARHQQHASPIQAEQPDHDADVVQEAIAAVAVTEIDYSDIAQFPKGASAGTFLHKVFEIACEDDRDWCSAQLTNDVIEQALSNHGFDLQWLPAIRHLLTNVLGGSLSDGEGLSLQKVDASQRRAELGFYFTLHQLDAGALQRCLLAHGYPYSEGSLRFENLSGLMKGFIDLTFSWKGRYYILDYKSNYLGSDTSAYTAAAMTDAIQEHQYDLQYLIYTVALHRYLQKRLPHYDYDQHMGGAYYLFIRGMQAHAEATPGVYFQRPSRALIEALDQLFLEGVTDAE